MAGSPDLFAIHAEAADPAWINGRRWDLGWLIGSALIVPVVLLLVWGGASAFVITMAVTAVVGGPHLFSTYIATYMDRGFRKSHGLSLLLISVAIPALVIYGTLTNFQVLLSAFIFLASFHVLQQNAYLTDIYRKRLGHLEPWWSRIVDYGLLLICIYPIASYKLVQSDFYLGDIEILLPPFLKVPATYWTVWIVFTGFLAAWLWKTAHEARQGVLNQPKTILIGVTTLIAFFVPMAATGERLELAFQSVNAWHSIQYLGIVWFVQKIRKERGKIDSKLVAAISGPGRRAATLFYGFCLVVTVAMLGGVYGLVAWNPLGLGYEQYYYMCVLSFLLIHYALDGYLFAVSNRKDADPEVIPYAAPASR